MELTNKRILITGGSSGLGFELAQLLVNKGAHIFICGRDQDQLDKAKIRLNSENVRAIKCDISDFSQVQSMANEIPNLDILINNAGTWLGGELEDNSVEDINRLLDTNLRGMIFCTNQFLSTLKKRDESFIVNIASIVAFEIGANQAVYNASKWGVRGFTESLQKDLKSTGVKVLGVYPSSMTSNMVSSTGVNPGMSNSIDKKFVAEEIVHVMQQDKSYITDTLIIRHKP